MGKSKIQRNKNRPKSNSDGSYITKNIEEKIITAAREAARGENITRPMVVSEAIRYLEKL